MNGKKILPVILFVCCFLSTFVTAQTTEAQTYTYEQAILLLTSSTTKTSSISEFTSKGIPAAAPTIGDQIKQIRLQKKVETNTLAKAIGITTNSLEKIELNLAIPTREILVDIEIYLDSDIIINTTE